MSEQATYGFLKDKYYKIQQFCFSSSDSDVSTIFQSINSILLPLL